MRPEHFVIGAIGITAVVGGAWALRERARGKAMEARAVGLGLAFSATDVELPSGLAELPLFGRGRRRRSRLHMTGRIADLELHLFDYQYNTGGGNSQSTHRMTVAAIRMPGAALPAFELCREHFGHRIAALVGFDDIDFDDDPEFSNRYRLTGPDAESVRARFSDAVRAHFMPFDTVVVEAKGEWMLARHGSRRTDPAKLDALIEDAFGIASALATV